MRVPLIEKSITLGGGPPTSDYAEFLRSVPNQALIWTRGLLFASSAIAQAGYAPKA